MGTSYKYKCDKCGFEKEFWVGGGFLTEDYWNETELEEEKFKTEVLEGKYGEHLKKVIELDPGSYYFDRGTDLYQCLKCRQFSIIRNKKIIYNKSEHYKQIIEFEQSCPLCDADWQFSKRSGMEELCPNCDGMVKLISIGKWD